MEGSNGRHTRERHTRERNTSLPGAANVGIRSSRPTLGRTQSQGRATSGDWHDCAPQRGSSRPRKLPWQMMVSTHKNAIPASGTAKRLARLDKCRFSYTDYLLTRHLDISTQERLYL